ncbi:MAG: hypothetical protein K2N30_05135 [Clostridia bacterium]|nr:hypothetical protein [Clostridia bacterium]
MAKGNRILNDELKRYFTTTGETRDCILGYIEQAVGRGSKSVVLCYRGDAASLYYRGRQLLQIYCQNGAIKGKFDFRYSRFSKDYKDVLEELTSLGVDCTGFNGEDENKRYVRLTLSDKYKNCINGDKLKRVFDIFIRLIEDFLNPNNLEYAYCKRDAVRKRNNEEKDRQQQLYIEHFFGDSDLIFYDIEYTEPDAGKKNVAGRFDLLGLRRNGDGYTLLFTELKSTKGACTGKAGVEKHEGDYLNYLAHSDLVKDRIKEAVAAIKTHCEIFGKPYPEGLCEENIAPKILFLFTDDAINYADKVKSKDIEVIQYM